MSMRPLSKPTIQLRAKLAKLERILAELAPFRSGPAHDALENCRRCGDQFCDGENCLYAEGAHGWHDQDAPEFTDADTPEELAETWWLPEDFGAGDPGANLADYPSQNVSPTPPKRQTTPGTLAPLQKTTTEDGLHKNTPFQVGATALSRRTPRRDFGEVEEQRASPPSPGDASSGDMAGTVTRLTPSVRNAHAPRQTVRALLEPGGKLHGIVDEALGYGDQAAPILARYVSEELGGRPDQHVRAVKCALLKIWKSEKEVA